MTEKNPAVPQPEPPAPTAAPPVPTPPTDPSAPDPAPRTFTQEELNQIIAARVAPLQAKASEYDKLVESQKSEAQKQAEAMAALQAENQAFKAVAARQSAAQAAGLPTEAQNLVTGSTLEEITASIEQVKQLISSLTGPKAPKPVPSLGQVGQPVGARSISEVRAEQASKYKKD